LIENGKNIIEYESGRISNLSITVSSNLIEENHKAYVNFISSLKSPITKKTYVFQLKNYLRSSSISFSTFDELLSRNPRIIEQSIIDILIDMRHRRQLSYSSQNGFLAAITHFFSINDISLNRKKIKKFMSEAENKYEYRSYTVEEISHLLEISDEREKVIIFLLASTGMRVGAVHPLQLKDLKRWVIDEQGNYIYQFNVYSSSSKFRYYTFCTPECAMAIDRYLELRKIFGEKLIKTETGWEPSNTYLIIRSFNKKYSYHNPIPITYRSSITRNILIPKLESINLRTRNTFSKNSINTVRQHRNNLHPCHSFRIFAITQMQRAKIDKTIQALLVGHSTGLDKFYYKPQEAEILQEYLKGIDFLTINNENRLKKQIQEFEYKNKENEYLIKARLHEREEEIKILKQKFDVFQENMEKRMQQLLLKVDMQKLL
jgi:integrase